MNNKTILIVGGTGLIGRALNKFLSEKGHNVLVLTRSPKLKNDVFWNPELKKIDITRLHDVQVIINLIGEGIAEKKWTVKRKQALIDSRVCPTRFLAEKTLEMSHLNFYIGASGINCYGFDRKDTLEESSPFGTDYLSTMVKEWESASDLFLPRCAVVKLRIAPVLTQDGGMIKKLMPLLFIRCVPVFGTGKQLLSWIHLDDLCELIAFCLDKRLEGVFNAVAANDTTLSFAKSFLNAQNKWGVIINIPSWILSLVFGEMAQLLLRGIFVSNKKIKAQGFIFKYNTIEIATQHLHSM